MKLSLLICILVLNCSTFETGRTVAKIPNFKRIAILPIDVKGREWGTEFSDAIGVHLLKLGKYEIVERAQLSKLINEQTFSNTGFVNTETATKLGQILGVEVLVYGKATPQNVLGVTNKTLVETASLNFVELSSGNILVKLRKEKGVDWTFKSYLKYLLFFTFVWDKKDLLVETSEYDYVAKQFANEFNREITKP